MEKAFEIYLYICEFIISIITLLGLIAVMLNIIAYFYQSFVGFDTFRKFLRKYHSEMKREKLIKADANKAFEKNQQRRTSNDR